MKRWLLGGLAMVMTVTLRAETPAKDAGAKPAGDAAPAASAPATSSEADTAWTKIKTDFAALKADSSAPSPDKLKGLLAEVHDFAAKYPTDPRALNATMLWAQVGDEMNRNKIPGGPSDAEIAAQFDKLASDDKVPKEKRAEIRLVQIVRAMQTAAEATGDSSALWDAVDGRIDAFTKEFGADFSFDQKAPAVAMLHAKEAQVLGSLPDQAARYKALLEKLVNDPTPQLAAMAKDMLDQQAKLAELKTKPLDLKFTAVDGTPVDLAKLRDKVVLVDFWATWCGPCVGEVPNVVAAYNKYHDKGFEIIGVSLDKDKSAMQAFTKAKGMVWPQYFDGQGWQNKISTSFGIDSIPAMWLVGKDGMLITQDAREDLAGQVAKALAAP